MGRGDDRRRTAQGQRVLGAVRLGAEILPPQLKVDIRSRLQDKIMFGTDHPSIPFDRLFREWDELGYSDDVMSKVFHRNAERILGV
ncbi:amidohydrolase family protein [Naasia aerilata]|uniref:Amidohydrolase-related domain-containing protein n=1 Tax=Naasia aerilata TaxID=1162966 RepID=A0ABN6XH15_9MICO|nr:amidohydrolase family protein [Naasia aerilata]BDZ44121.1 hypothetical protein GCM10025866_00300 [Naasia aerilata]BDZ47732.1 hypothetical protein GCM10025866_36410 [Naasia aerilata]